MDDISVEIKAFLDNHHAIGGLINVYMNYGANSFHFIGRICHFCQPKSIMSISEMVLRTCIGCQEYYYSCKSHQYRPMCPQC